MLPIALLLLVSLFLLVSISARTTRAVLEERNRRQVEAGIATGVLPWMSLSYISRVYDVPETDLLAALDLSDTEKHRRSPLRAIARYESRDVEADIATLNALIDARHPPAPRPRAVP